MKRSKRIVIGILKVIMWPILIIGFIFAIPFFWLIEEDLTLWGSAIMCMKFAFRYYWSDL